MRGLIVEAGRDGIQREAIAHCEHVWPLIRAGKSDPEKIDEANAYLDGVLAGRGRAMHDIVIRMLAWATGVSWDAIRDQV